MSLVPLLPLFHRFNREYFDGLLVKRVTTVKYLGVKLDGNLKGDAHACEIVKKCAGRISFLYRNASLLDFYCRKTLCSSLILPNLDYCCSSWYIGLTKQLRNKLDVLQRRVIRFIFSMDARDHVGTGHLRQLTWLSIQDRVKYFKLCHIFRIRHGLAPGYLSSGFVSITDTHSHLTRGSTFNYTITKDMCDSPTTFLFTAAKLWNNLPNELKNINSFMVFRTKLKLFLSSDY